MSSSVTVEEVQQVVLDVICDIQRQSGRPLPEVICGTVCPIGDFEGFDSINAVEVSVQVTTRLGCEFAGNAFVTESGSRALKVSEVAERLHKLVNGNGGEAK